MSLREILKSRILVLDGAMGTMIQRYALNEDDFRGDRFKEIPGSLQGNNDILVLTRPDVIREIHNAYLAAGADIIETNSFNANSVSMQDYHMEAFVYEMNFEAARIAREAANEFTLLNPDKPRFVAGSVGPTNKTTSISPDVNNPSFRNLTYDQLESSYTEQMKALIEGGVDLLLIETVFDTLNAKAALSAAQKANQITGKKIPVMLSLTVSDKGGRTLSGQTIDAFLASVMHADLLSVGLNCSFGARDMKPFLKQLGEKAPYFISSHPNAGLPNTLGEYDETPELMASQIKEYLEEGLVNIIGGCCGTTPDHIALYDDLLETAALHQVAPEYSCTLLSGLEPLEIKKDNNFINVGERCNVAGSRKFLRLIKEKKYEEALTIARQQVEDGAQIIDINMDDSMLDAKEEMVTFLNLMASDPDVSKVPVMIDSSKFDVIEAGLKCVQGKSIVNSISLKEGEEAFLENAQLVKSLGAAVVVMAFDEVGQADSYERKIEICERAYRLLVDKAGFNPSDIIFDPNILAIATGIREHNNYSVDFINATRWIKQNLPSAKVSGGVSNLSFSFRGNNYIREAMHAVFLFHAIKAGMDMGIVNPATSITYADIPEELLVLIEDVVLNRNEEATERLIEAAESLKAGPEVREVSPIDERVSMSVEQRLEKALLKGDIQYLEQDIKEALIKYERAIDIIDGPLMAAMNEVGILFGDGKMFLPQVVKSARTMKKAVELLQPEIEKQKHAQDSSTLGKFLVATVKGDVHDIGKNIVSVILACNNFEVIDLGVMVPMEEIIRTAIENEVDFIGLSGLITPSLEEMSKVADAMEKAGLRIPLMIGGATTSKLHTAVKIAPFYSGAVFHLKDAAQNPVVASQYMNPESRMKIVESLREEQELLRRSLDKKEELTSYVEACEKRVRMDWENYIPPVPLKMGVTENNTISIQELRPFINWRYFFKAWKVSNDPQLYQDALELLAQLEANPTIKLAARIGFFPAVGKGESISIQEENKNRLIPVLRQQHPKEEKSHYLSLVDFIAPETSGRQDYIGTFVVSIGKGFSDLLDDFKKEGDEYRILLLQSVGDRLVEAASEWLHAQVRKEYWGYAPEENLSEEEIRKMHFRGIRPAVGYPSLPDQSLNFILDELLDFSKVGVTLTENGAMYPNATVSGFYFSHPKATYFMIGSIDSEQRKAYAEIRGMDEAEIRKYIP